MHDLYEAQRILKLALTHAEKNNFKEIREIVIELGEIEDHGEILNSQNLRFNLLALAEKTIARNTKIVIKKIKGNYWKLKEIKGK